MKLNSTPAFANYTTEYDTVVVYTTPGVNGCGFGGVATGADCPDRRVRCWAQLMNCQAYASQHELGHNWGLNHAATDLFDNSVNVSFCECCPSVLHPPL